MKSRFSYYGRVDFVIAQAEDLVHKGKKGGWISFLLEQKGYLKAITEPNELIIDEFLDREGLTYTQEAAPARISIFREDWDYYPKVGDKVKVTIEIGGE
jgi:hypothetical protein